MKFDRYSIRLISGFVFIIAISIAVFVTHSYVKKSEKEVNIKYDNNIKSGIGFIDITQINHTEEIQNKNFNNEKRILKEDIFDLIDDGIKEQSIVNCFIYTKELFESERLRPLFVNDEYKEIINYLDIQKFKDDKYIVYTLANTNEYMWGYFYNINNTEENNTYFIIDKTTGMLKNLNNDLRQVIIY